MLTFTVSQPKPTSQRRRNSLPSLKWPDPVLDPERRSKSDLSKYYDEQEEDSPPSFEAVLRSLRSYQPHLPPGLHAPAERRTRAESSLQRSSSSSRGAKRASDPGALHKLRNTQYPSSPIEPLSNQNEDIAQERLISLSQDIDDSLE